MERLLALWAEPLGEERPDGSTLRDYLRILDVVGVLCPFVEPVRLGLCTLPLRGPSRFFGGDEAVFAAVRHSVRDVLGLEVSLGVAEGLFCAELAARQEVVLASGQTTAFRRVQPLAVLGHKELTTTGRRLGVYTVGDFADLDAVEQRLHGFARHYEQIAKPFDWKFTRQDLNELLDRLGNDQPCQLAA